MPPPRLTPRQPSEPLHASPAWAWALGQSEPWLPGQLGPLTVHWDGSEDGNGAPHRVCWEDFNKVTQGLRIMSGTEQMLYNVCCTSSRGGVPPPPTSLPLAPGSCFTLGHIRSSDLSPRCQTSRASPPRLSVSTPSLPVLRCPLLRKWNDLLPGHPGQKPRGILDASLPAPHLPPTIWSIRSDCVPLPRW